MNVTVNQADLSRILRKLKDASYESLSHAGHTYKYIWHVLDEYRQAVVSVMGVVDGYNGGSAQSTGIQNNYFRVNWSALSDETLAYKKAEGWSLKIWEASGKTKRAIRVTGNFAGVDANWDIEAYQHAVDSEEVYGRGLFSQANILFGTYGIKNIILDNIRNSFIKDCYAVGWGQN